MSANEIFEPPASGSSEPTESGAASIDLPAIIAAKVPPPRFPAIHDAVLDIEHTWLGLTSPTFFDRAAAARWQPDAAGSYCPRCGVSTGEYEALDPLDAGVGQAGCPQCRSEAIPWSRFARLGEYEGLLRDAILEVKYTRWRRLGRDLGRVLGLQLLPLLARAQINPADIILVPTPATLWRRLTRGIDHTLALSRGVRDITGGRIVHALSRRHRTPQSRLSRPQRAGNVSGSMVASRRGRGLSAFVASSTSAKAIILIDDIKTTGATLREACRALASGFGAGGKQRVAECVWVATVAAAGLRDRTRGGTSE